MQNTKKTLCFPKNFLWGSATSSHQVEGGNHNDWSEWEKKNAVRLARESSKHFSRFPSWEFTQKEAEDPKNYLSENACDHYHRYEEDFGIAASLGHNAHRFSIEWSRIEPEEGIFDEQEIEHYRNVLVALRKRNIEPFVTLWHWTLPVWLAEQGGFASKKFPEYFARYAEKLAQAFGPQIKFWVTLNEPDVVASHAYMKGAWPPQKKNFLLLFRTLNNLIKAHKLAYGVIKKYDPDSEVGIAKHQVAFEVARKTPINLLLKTIAHFGWNQWFLDRIRKHQDFIGLNHYNRNVIDNGFYKNPNKRVTDFGWEFFPESIYWALLELKSYQKPIYITENGLADMKDAMREEFLRRSLAAVHRAITEDVDVRGYLYWSLLDNFEWDKGYWPRFGLVSIDRKTMKRTIRPSAYTYKKICDTNALEIE